MKYLSKAETDLFLSVLNRPRDKIMFHAMLFNGLRVGEVVGEELDYWAYKGEYIYPSKIPKSFKDIPTNKEQDGYIHVNTTIPGLHLEDIDWEKKFLSVLGKGNKTRIIPISPPFFQTLVDCIKPFEIPAEERVGRIIFKKNGKPITTHQVRNICRKLAEEAGFKKRIHPHMFRHTFAINYIRMGGTVDNLRKILGHGSLATTQIYLDAAKEDMSNEMNKVMAEIPNIEQKSESEVRAELARKILGGM